MLRVESVGMDVERYCWADGKLLGSALRIWDPGVLSSRGGSANQDHSTTSLKSLRYLVGFLIWANQSQLLRVLKRQARAFG